MTHLKFNKCKLLQIEHNGTSMEVAVNWAQMENLKGLHFSCCNLWLRGLDHLKEQQEKDNFFRDEMLPEDTQNFMDWEKNKCQCPWTARRKSPTTSKPNQETKTIILWPH